MYSRDFILKFKDLSIGVFQINGSFIRYSPIKEHEHMVPPRIFYPTGMYNWIDPSCNVTKMQSSPPSADNISVWMSERLFPPDRQGATGLLRGLGLDRYDLVELILKTKGISYNDYYWITDNPQERYEDVHPRAKLESSSTEYKGSVGKTLGMTKDTELNISEKPRGFFEDSDIFGK